MNSSWLTIGMLVILAVLIFFMFRNSRKQRARQAELQQQVVPGAEVMTSFGLFGTVVSIDDENNKVALETSPGQILTVHRQTVTKVVESTVPAADDNTAPTEPELNTDHAIKHDDAPPAYGERIDDTNKSSTDKPNKADE